MSVAISHPEKLLFPEDGISKGEVAAYYELVAPLMLPHIAGRPITMERFPAGIGKKGFLQKDVIKGFPSWLARVAVERREPGARAGRDDEPPPDPESGSVHYPLALADDLRGRDTLQWLANQNCITPHVWSSRVPELEVPDLCVFDLDPSEDEPGAVRAAALAVRDVLDELALPSFVKTSGSKGFHVLVPLDAAASAHEVWRFALGVGALLVERHAATLTQEFIKADREGKIFVDTGRNAPGATFAAVYAVRARPGAPVSAPCSWEELSRGTVAPRTFGLREMRARLDEVGDLWQGFEAGRVSLAAALGEVERRLGADDWKEAVAATTRRPKSRKRAR